MHFIADHLFLEFRAGARLTLFSSTSVIQYQTMTLQRPSRNPSEHLTDSVSKHSESSVLPPDWLAGYISPEWVYPIENIPDWPYSSEVRESLRLSPQVAEDNRSTDLRLASFN